LPVELVKFETIFGCVYSSKIPARFSTFSDVFKDLMRNFDGRADLVIARDLIEALRSLLKG